MTIDNSASWIAFLRASLNKQLFSKSVSGALVQTISFLPQERLK